MRKPEYQFFSLEEYQQRMDALRRRMEEKGVDAMLVHTPENLYYLTGYQTPGYYWYQTLIVPMDRDPVFITRNNEATNIEPLTWVEDSRPLEVTDDGPTKTRDALEDLGLVGQRVGVEKQSWFITIEQFERLKAMMPDTTFVDCSWLVEQGRLIKSSQEVEYIRQAARAAEAGLMAGIEATEVGATENEVAVAVHRAQILAGSEYTGLLIFVKSGPRWRMTHATWYRRRLEPNELVYFEIPGCINRYHAAFIRPVWLGHPPDWMVRASEVVIETLQLAKSHIRAGVKAGDVYEAAQENLYAKLGVRRLTRIAYSIGIAFAPDWGEGHILSMAKGEQRSLQANMTFHLLTGVVLPERAQVSCTDTIRVTEDGCETLTDRVERKLYVR